MTASSHRLIRSASSGTKHSLIWSMVLMPTAAKWTSCHDQNHRRALQSLLFSKLPRADRHHLRLRRRLAEVLPNGRAAARRVDEATPAERLAAWRCVIGKQDGTAA